MTRRLVSGEISEEDIQKCVISYVRSHPYLKKFSQCVIHLPNEGKRTPRYGKLMKDMGLRPGVADLLITLARRGYHGAWIELKSKSGRLNPNQAQFLDDMSEQGYYTCVCRSIDDTINIIEWYCDESRPG